MKLNQKLILITAGLFIIILSLIGLASAQMVIQDEKVYINDSTAYISATPHTLKSSGWVTFEVQPKTYSGNLNGIWGFNVSQARPTKAEYYSPHNTTNSLTCDDNLPDVWYNYTLNPKHAWCWWNMTTHNCSLDNLTCVSIITPILRWEHDFYKADLPSDTVYYNTTEEWRDITERFGSVNTEFDEKNRWYYITDVPVIMGTKYTLRAWIDIPICLTEDATCPSHSKYDFAVYPSSYGSNIISAHSNGYLYYLDPWWNASWAYYARVNVTARANITSYPLFHQINFTDYISVGNHLIAHSIRVLETDASLDTFDEIPYYFAQGKNWTINTTLAYNNEFVWDNSTNAYGTLLWTMNGSLANGSTRYYAVYFDVSENGAKDAPTYTGAGTESDATFFIATSGTNGMDYGFKRTRGTSYLRPNNISTMQHLIADNGAQNVGDALDDNVVYNNKYQDLHGASSNCDWQLNESQIVQMNCTTWDCFGTAATPQYCHQNVSCFYGAGCFVNWKTKYNFDTNNAGSNYWHQTLGATNNCGVGTDCITETTDKQIITDVNWVKQEKLRTTIPPIATAPAKYVAFWETGVGDVGNGQNGLSHVEFRMDDTTTALADTYSPNEGLGHGAGTVVYKDFYAYWLHDARPFSTNATYTFDQMARSFLNSPPLINLGVLNAGDTTAPNVVWNWTFINKTYNPFSVSDGTNDIYDLCVNSSEAMNCTLHINGSLWVNHSSSSSICFYNLSVPEGNYSTLYATCEDPTGNRANTTIGWVDIDTTAPVVTNVFPVSQQAWFSSSAPFNTTNTTINFQANATDGGRVQNCSLWMNNATFWGVLNTSCNVSFMGTYWFVECMYTFPGYDYRELNWSVTCVDNATNEYGDGNQGSSFLQSNLTIDNTAPVTTWGWADQNMTTTTNTTTVIVTSSELVNCTLHINVSGIATSYPNATLGTTISWNLTNMQNGNYTMNITCDDYLGNEANSTDSWWNVDRPQATDETTGGGGSGGGSAIGAIPDKWFVIVPSLLAPINEYNLGKTAEFRFGVQNNKGEFKGEVYFELINETELSEGERATTGWCSVERDYEEYNYPANELTSNIKLECDIPLISLSEETTFKERVCVRIATGSLKDCAIISIPFAGPSTTPTGMTALVDMAKENAPVIVVSLACIFVLVIGLKSKSSDKRPKSYRDKDRIGRLR